MTVADLHLSLFLTRGMSLAAWRRNGQFEREVALYRRLRSSLGGLSMVSYGGADDLAIADELDGIDVVVNRWRLPQSLYARMLPGWRPRAGGICKSNQVPGAEVALAGARRRNQHFIARCGYMHGEFVARSAGETSSATARARALEAKVFGAADAAVVTTAAMRDELLNRYHVPAAKIEVIPNYVDTDLFRPIETPPRAKPRLCFLGRLHDQKNPFALLEALEGLDLELWMIGRGPFEADLRAQAEARGLDVQFLGTKANDELPAIYAECDIFVLPSHYEGHPKALLEAMSCGMAVVGAEVPGIAEVIDDDETGVFCGTDAASIRAALAGLAADADRRARLGASARGYIERTLSLDLTVDRELALLDRVASGH